MVYLGSVVCAAVAMAEQKRLYRGEIGWSYACTAIAAILSPILVGSLTDRFFAAQKVLAVLMFAGAILMYFAAQQTQFSTFSRCCWPTLTYMPTIALTNSIAFANVDDVEADFPRIRVMGTIGWIASGLACGFLPQMLGYSDISDTNIPLLMTAASSALLGVFALSCRIRRRKVPASWISK